MNSLAPVGIFVVERQVVVGIEVLVEATAGTVVEFVEQVVGIGALALETEVVVAGLEGLVEGVDIAEEETQVQRQFLLPSSPKGVTLRKQVTY